MLLALFGVFFLGSVALCEIYFPDPPGVVSPDGITVIGDSVNFPGRYGDCASANWHANAEGLTVLYIFYVEDRDTKYVGPPPPYRIEIPDPSKDFVRQDTPPPEEKSFVMTPVYDETTNRWTVEVGVEYTAPGHYQHSIRIDDDTSGPAYDGKVIVTVSCDVAE